MKITIITPQNKEIYQQEYNQQQNKQLEFKNKYNQQGDYKIKFENLESDNKIF